MEYIAEEEGGCLVPSELKVQSLDRAFDILELLGLEQNGYSLVQISERLGLPKSTVHGNG